MTAPRPGANRNALPHRLAVPRHRRGPGNPGGPGQTVAHSATEAVRAGLGRGRNRRAGGPGPTVTASRAGWRCRGTGGRPTENTRAEEVVAPRLSSRSEVDATARTPRSQDAH